MGLGTDLIRFFERQTLADDGRTLLGRPIYEFAKANVGLYGNPAVNLAAAQRLCDAGRLHQVGSVGSSPLIGNTYALWGGVADLQADLDYGTFDFIVDGLPAVVEKLGSSVLQLIGTRRSDRQAVSGTAFLTGSQRVILTARHCVDGIELLEVEYPSGTGNMIAIEGDPLFTSTGDTAVLTLAESIPHQPLVIATDPKALDRVVTLGFPALAGLEPSLLSSAGEIAGMAANYLDGQHEYFLTTCAVTGGSSGGPVIRDDGRVVGVVSAFSERDSVLDPGRFGLVSPVLPAAAGIANAANRAERSGHPR